MRTHVCLLTHLAYVSGSRRVAGATPRMPGVGGRGGSVRRAYRYGKVSPCATKKG